MRHCALQSNISRTMQPEHIPSENDEPGDYNSVSSQSSTSLKYLTYEQIRPDPQQHCFIPSENPRVVPSAKAAKTAAFIVPLSEKTERRIRSHLSVPPFVGPGSLRHVHGHRGGIAIGTAGSHDQRRNTPDQGNSDILPFRRDSLAVHDSDVEYFSFMVVVKYAKQVRRTRFDPVLKPITFPCHPRRSASPAFIPIGGDGQLPDCEGTDVAYVKRNVRPLTNLFSFVSIFGVIAHQFMIRASPLAVMGV